MKLEQLRELIDSGADTASLLAQNLDSDTAATLVEALGQRMLPVKRGHWEPEEDGALCECGLLLVRLPRPVRQYRVVTVMGVRRREQRDLAWVHVAPGVCPECWDEPEPCAEHAGEMCDAPVAELCPECGDAELPVGMDLCRPCARAEEGPEFDSDLYYGLSL